MDVIKVVFILLVCGAIAIVAGGGGDGASPQPTPTPASDGAAVVNEVMTGLEPLIVSSAGAVDAVTEASKADTRTVHPDPKPSFYETWGVALTSICIVGLVVGIPSLAVIVYMLIRAGIVAQVVTLLAVKQSTGGK